MMVADVLMDRLLHELPRQHFPLVNGSFVEGRAIFQALVSIGSQGAYADGEVFGFGFSLETCLWFIAIYHTTLATMPIGARLPEICLTYQDGDVVRIKARYEELMRKIEVASAML